MAKVYISNKDFNGTFGDKRDIVLVMLYGVFFILSTIISMLNFSMGGFVGCAFGVVCAYFSWQMFFDGIIVLYCSSVKSKLKNKNAHQKQEEGWCGREKS